MFNIEQEDDYENLYCILCDGELRLLGVLGNKIWYSCRYCGLEQESTDQQ